MSNPDVLSPAEERIEELRAIRQRLFGNLADDLGRLRALGNEIPEDACVLSGVHPIVPLGIQLRAANTHDSPR
jgi:hypothetical protein